MMRSVLLAMAACFFVSCYSIPNIKAGSRFSPQAKTGYLMFVVDIEGDPAGLILRAYQDWWILPGVADWHNLKTGKNFIFIKVIAASYKFDAIFDRSLKRVFTDFALEDFYFTVENGVITYGGDLMLKLDESRSEHGSRILNVRCAYRDAYPDAVAYLRTNYPEIPDTITIRNQCPETSEHYYRPVITAGD
jgi:hypothetical protein